MKPLPLILGIVALISAAGVGLVSSQEIGKLGAEISSLRSELKKTSETSETSLEKIQDKAAQSENELKEQIAEQKKTLLAALKKKPDRSEISKISEEDTHALIQKVQDGVVFVKTGQGAGSGFVVNDEGRMLTNCHVVQSFTSVSIMTWSEDWVSADVVARDPVADIAILQITPECMDRLKKLSALPKALKFADSETVKVGDRIFTMGAPHELTKTVNAGQVSNIERYLPGLPILNKVSGLYNIYFQVDAGVMPGNSGGPSINMKGEIVGINTRANYTNESEGFVLPSNFVKDRMESLLNSPDKVNRYNTLGFDFEPFTRRSEEAAANIRLLPEEYESGLIIGRVFQDSPAFRAGIRSNDLILEINGGKVNCDARCKVVAYRRDVAFGKPGSEYDLKIKHLDFRDPMGRVVQEGAIEKLSVRVVSEEDYSLPVAIPAIRAYVNVAPQSEVPTDCEGAVKISEMFNPMDMNNMKINAFNSADYALMAGDLVVQVEEQSVKDLGTMSEAFKQILSQRRFPTALTVIREGKKVVLPLRQQMRQPPRNQPRKTEIF